MSISLQQHTTHIFMRWSEWEMWVIPKNSTFYTTQNVADSQREAAKFAAFFHHKVVMLSPAVFKLSPVDVTWSPCRCTTLLFVVSLSLVVVTYSPYSRAVPSQLQVDKRVTEISMSFRLIVVWQLPIVVRLSCYSRQGHKKWLHFLTTFALFLPPRYRISVVIRYERGITH